MNMVQNSDILLTVYNAAEELQKNYESSSLSQIHIFCALVMLCEQQEGEFSSHAEVVEAKELIQLEFSALMLLKDRANNVLMYEPVIPYEETMAWENSFRLAVADATLASDNLLTLPMLIKQIVENPSERMQKLFLHYRKGESEEYNEDLANMLGKAEKKAEEVTEEPCEETDSEEEPQFLYCPPPHRAEPGLSGLTVSIKHMQNILRKRVYGQDEAIFAVVSGYFNAFARGGASKRGNQPKAVFLFAGAPGVGKTYLAQVAARAMRLSFRRFDMSSYNDKESALEFAGTDKVYRNAHEGQVTGFVKKHPRCVLLFDEIEKAHVNIIHLFLQILDAGTLKDSYTGENVSFKDVVIIMTTNAGKSLYEQMEPGAPMPSRKVIMHALSTEINPATGYKVFPEAICSRFAAGNIVLFNPLGAQELLDIAQSCLNDYAQGFESGFQIQVKFDSDVSAALLFAEGGQADARALKGRAANFVSSELYNWTRFAFENEEIDLDEIRTIRVCAEVGAEDPSKLFALNRKPTVLLYSESEDAYQHLTVSEEYQFLVPSTLEDAEKLVATEEIDLAICDVLGVEATTLNIEDIASSGRRLMDLMVKERIPVFVYNSALRRINGEERQAFLENGASGVFDQETEAVSLQKLSGLCKRVHIESMLNELRRAKKVLTYDCTYDWNGNDIGIITLKNMRIMPAIEAQDQQDIAEITATNTTFDRIIGAEDAKAELKNFLSYLKYPRVYAKNGVPAPKGVILYGPPGTGKTMLAKALAHESGATFIATQGNNFLRSRLGDGAQEVKRLFAMARKYAPSVLFIDEIDIVAQDRMTSGIAADVINALLNEMDGFSTHPSRPVFVLAATNFDVSFGQKSSLDPALLRRFDRRIFVDLPDRQERITFIRTRLAKSNQMLSDAAIENIALRSTGMSLAELEAVIDLALRSMLQSGLCQLSDRLFDDAFETYRLGKKTDWDEDVLNRIAVHEAGHAVLSYLCGNKPIYITVSGRSNYGGYMQNEEAGPLQTKKQLLGNIRTALAGRAAEIVFFGEEDGISTGAAGDLKMATEIAMQMITIFGMSEEHGIMFDGETPVRDETVKLCNQILAEELNLAVAQLTEHREHVQRLVDALVRKNHLMGNEIAEMFAK